MMIEKSELSEINKKVKAEGKETAKYKQFLQHLSQF